MSSRGQHDSEDLIEALRSERPASDQRERIRARLAAAGVVGVAAASTSATASAAAAIAAGDAVAAAGGASSAAGVTAAGTVPLAAKLALAVVLASGVAGMPIVMRSHSAAEREAPTQRAAMRAGANENASGAAQAALPSQTLAGASRASTAAATQVPVPAVQLPLRPQPMASPEAVTGEPASTLPAKPTTLTRMPEAISHAPAIAARTVPKVKPAAMLERAHAVEPTAALAASPAVEPVAALDAVAAPVPQMQSGGLGGGGTIAGARAQSAPPTASRLGEESALLERALSALRAGDTAAARTLLEAHAQQFPAGSLAPERERARRRLEQHTQSSRPLQLEVP